MTATSGGMDQRRIFVHIGLFKTGTTYLQNVLQANRTQLTAQQVLYPGAEGQPLQRVAVWDLFGRRPRGTSDQRVPGQWRALADLVAASPAATAVISEESLSVASVQQARRVVASFAAREVHVVVTVRDLARVLVSAWQEDLKNGYTWTWAEFSAGVRDGAGTGRIGRRFWRSQDLARILDTWRSAVPVERIHVVTVPPPGAPQSELLARFASVVGFDPAALTGKPRYSNESLGVAGAEVVRRFNESLADSLNDRQYDKVMKLAIVRHLANASPSRCVLPAEDEEWVATEAERLVAILRSDYSVTGNLDDLLVREGVRGRRPDDATPEELFEAAMVALTGLGKRYATAWWQRREPERPRVEQVPRLERARSVARGVRFRWLRAALDLADRNRLAGAPLRGYLTVRDASRRRASHRTGEDRP